METKENEQCKTCADYEYCIMRKDKEFLLRIQRRGGIKMSFAMMGLTHCNDCMQPLGMNEHFYCKSCQEKHDKEDAEMEEKRKQETLKAEIVSEVREVVGNDLMKELVKSRFNSPKEIYIGTMKPNNMKWDDWYADIGHQVMAEYEKGNDGLLVSFVKLEEKEVDKNDEGNIDG